MGPWSDRIRAVIRKDTREPFSLSLSLFAFLPSLADAEERPHEDTERRWPCTSQEGNSYQRPTMPAP